MLHLRAQVAEARESAQQAQVLATGVSRRERQQIEAIALFVNGQGPRSYALIREHLADYPRDILMIRLAQRLFALGCSGAGVASFPAVLLALMQSVASAYGDDWAFLGQYAFAHHETGHLEEARRLAERSLELRPTNAVAAHSVAHVFFERGDPSGGGASTRGRPTTSTSPGLRRCSSWRGAVTSGPWTSMRRTYGRRWSQT
jgi:Flp pilus assembly protein TadD